MTIPHFKKIIDRISDLEWLIDRVTIDTEYDEDTDVGIIGGSIIFKDGSVLHFKEVLLGDKRHYRFHYMDAENGLISRWDSAPHHKDLKTFPYHVHLPDGVRESMEVTFMDVFDEIKNIVAGGLQGEEN